MTDPRQTPDCNCDDPNVGAPCSCKCCERARAFGPVAPVVAPDGTWFSGDAVPAPSPDAAGPVAGTPPTVNPIRLDMNEPFGPTQPCPRCHSPRCWGCGPGAVGQPAPSPDAAFRALVDALMRSALAAHRETLGTSKLVAILVFIPATAPRVAVEVQP